MNKVIALCFLFCLGANLVVPGNVYADSIGVSVPVTQKGDQASIDYAGAKVYNLTGVTEVMISTGSGVIHGVIISSNVTGTNYIILRDTSTNDGSGTQTLPNIWFSASTATQVLSFPVPIRYNIGLTAIAVNNEGKTLVFSVVYSPR